MASVAKPIGKPIGSFQLVQDLLAKMLANNTASQCLVVRTAQLEAEGKLTDAHAPLAKAFCTAKCRETVACARELLSGNGIVADYNVARFFADAEAPYSYEGTYQMQNLIVGKAVTGLSALSSRRARVLTRHDMNPGVPQTATTRSTSERKDRITA